MKYEPAFLYDSSEHIVSVNHHDHRLFMIREMDNHRKVTFWKPTLNDSVSKRHKCEIELFPRKQIQAMHFSKKDEAKPKSIEHLLHDWHVIQTSTFWAAYSDSAETGFVLEKNEDFPMEVLMSTQFELLKMIQYFDQAYFEEKLKKLNTNCSNFFKLEGMTPAKKDLIFNERARFFGVVSFGFAIEDLIKLPEERLNKILLYVREFDSLLDNAVSREHLLGKEGAMLPTKPYNHSLRKREYTFPTSPVKKEVQKKEGKLSLEPGEDNKLDFSLYRDAERKLPAHFSILNAKEIVDKKGERLEGFQEHLVRTWTWYEHCIYSDESEVALKHVMTDWVMATPDYLTAIDPGFDFPYIEELLFEKYLKESCGLSIQQLRDKYIDQRDAQKMIELLFDNQPILKNLISRGITVEELSRVKLQRLGYLFNHFEPSIRAVELGFVTLHQLLELPPPKTRLELAKEQLEQAATEAYTKASSSFSKVPTLFAWKQPQHSDAVRTEREEEEAFDAHLGEVVASSSSASSGSSLTRYSAK